MSLPFSELLKKYDVPVPRYTSYPTVPAWNQTPSNSQWFADIRETLQPEDSGWSMYVHVPFCETLCTFCGCNTIITKNHKNEGDYVDLILKEWSLYLSQVPELKSRPLKHLHLGGGTPTFLAPEQLHRLAQGILSKTHQNPSQFEASIEVDPRRTTVAQLQVLKEAGFQRISLGVQDFNEKVQKLINRVQPYSITEKITTAARELKYESVNFDLIYGLPQQDLEMLEITLEKTLKLRPDRIAFYSFALVPWIKPAQRLFKDSDLPSSDQKRELYEKARARFLAEGYLEVGMDHFALPTDTLVKAQKSGQLHRNFMGYTDKKTDLLLGLGVSSISESKNMFHQNEKLLPRYQEELEKDLIPSVRGHILSARDQAQKSKILQLMTQYSLKLTSVEEKLEAEKKMAEFLDLGLIRFRDENIEITDLGKPFLRNICSVFDDFLPQNQTQKLFSKSI